MTASNSAPQGFGHVDRAEVSLPSARIRARAASSIAHARKGRGQQVTSCRLRAYGLEQQARRRRAYGPSAAPCRLRALWARTKPLRRLRVRSVNASYFAVCLHTGTSAEVTSCLRPRPRCHALPSHWRKSISALIAESAFVRAPTRVSADARTASACELEHRVQVTCSMNRIERTIFFDPLLTLRAPCFMVTLPMQTRTLSIQPMFRASETRQDCVHYLPASGNQEKVT